MSEVPLYMCADFRIALTMQTTIQGYLAYGPHGRGRGGASTCGRLSLRKNMVHHAIGAYRGTSPIRDRPPL